MRNKKIQEHLNLESIDDFLFKSTLKYRRNLRKHPASKSLQIGLTRDVTQMSPPPRRSERNVA